MIFPGIIITRFGLFPSNFFIKISSDNMAASISSLEGPRSIGNGGNSKSVRPAAMATPLIWLRMGSSHGLSASASAKRRTVIAIGDKKYNYGAEFQAENASIQIVLGRNNGTSVQGRGAIGADATNAFAVWNTTSTC